MTFRSIEIPAGVRIEGDPKPAPQCLGLAPGWLPDRSPSLARSSAAEAAGWFPILPVLP